MIRAIIGLASIIFLWSCCLTHPPEASPETNSSIQLPKPRLMGELSVEQALKLRRSTRSYRAQPLTIEQVSQLLWAAQGISGHRFRTAPSAGALYPLEVHLVVGDVEGLAAGVYRYTPGDHSLKKTVEGDIRQSLARAAYWQQWAGKGAVALVFSAVYERTTQKYGDRGIRYVHIEVGHAAQNVYLQAEALGLGTVMVGAFIDTWVSRLLHLKDDEQPLGIMPVGKPK